MLKPTTTPCPQCSQAVVLYVSDAPVIMNGPYVSALILQHPDHVTCANCGTVLAPAIIHIGQLRIIATPVPPRESVQRVVSVG